MRSRILYVLCAVGVGASAASAQPRPGPVVALPARPAVSPYLNLLRPGNSPGVNYYGIVRPQLEFRSSIQLLQQQLQTPLAPSPLAEPGGAVLPVTGHATTFLNSGGYYSGRTSGPTAARPASGVQAPSRPPVRR